MTSFINVIWSQDAENKLLKPRGSVLDVELNITYDISSSGSLLSELVFPSLIRRAVEVYLDIIVEPDWSRVSLSVTNLNFNINEDLPDNKTVNLFVIAKKDAPAFQPDIIRIKAFVDPIKGPFGINILVENFSKSFYITNSG